MSMKKPEWISRACLTLALAVAASLSSACVPRSVTFSLGDGLSISLCLFSNFLGTYPVWPLSVRTSAYLPLNSTTSTVFPALTWPTDFAAAGSGELSGQK